MSELLLELFSEEIPALIQKNAEKTYKNIFTKIFVENEIFADIKVFIGPRRISIYISKLPQFILSKEIEIKGPKINASNQAIEGFCYSHNINKNNLSTILVHDQLYYIYKKKIEQKNIRELLQDILPIAIGTYVWPKSMYWGDYNISWIRPLRNILCIFDKKILPIKYGHLIGNNITYGHRAICNDAIIVDGFIDYKEKLIQNYVIIDRVERQEIIKTQLSFVAEKYFLSIKQDEELLEEVTGLVEFPMVMIGKIPEKFLSLPQEVLITAMKTHQKYFSTFDKEHNFAPYFLFVANITIYQDLVIKGNEKVLSARLSDALYFYHQDLLRSLDSRLIQLEQIIFHTKLESLKKKTDRIIEICNYLVKDNSALQVAAKLCKSDLTSEMVNEFPELQAIMGYYYAISEGIDINIAISIRDHYKPKGPSDTVPIGDAAILALADKLDSLIGLMLIGEIANGSKDPYALRRQALGIIRIILENKLHLNIKQLIIFSANIYSSKLNIIVTNNNIQLIQSFLEERTKFYFKNKYDITLINSVLDFNIEEDLVIIEMKLLALKEFLVTNEGQNLVTSYKRVNNILINSYPVGEINKKLFISEYEQELYNILIIISQQFDIIFAKQDLANSLILFQDILLPINNFFDNVMVKDNNLQVTNNRLLLLQMIKQLFNKIANFDFL